MDNSHTQHQAKTYVVVAVVGVVPVADRAAQIVRFVVPGTAVSCSAPPANVNDEAIFGKSMKRAGSFFAAKACGQTLFNSDNDKKTVSPPLHFRSAVLSALI